MSASRPTRNALEGPDANQLQGQAAQGPAHRGDRPDPAQVRALRLLHGHLPHLRPARRRARQPARAHLPDEGDVRAGSPRHARRAPACRPLFVLPVVHDDLPERGRLHAPRRLRARAYRRDQPAQPQGSHDPAAAGVDAALSGPFSHRAQGRAVRTPVHRLSAPGRAERADGDARSGADGSAARRRASAVPARPPRPANGANG